MIRSQVLRFAVVCMAILQLVPQLAIMLLSYLTLFAPFDRMTNSISFLQLEVSQD